MAAFARALAAFLVLPAAIAAQDGTLSVRAGVQSQQVYVGQPFLFQVQIQGSDSPDPVDIGPLEADFAVSESGGGASNSTSVTIVNGRVTQSVRRGYNLNYRLAARRAGNLEIPPLVISVEGQSASTRPISVRVLPPQENDDFKLRLRLSDARAYVGQPVVLTVDWYIGREVREYGFAMPLLDDDRFEVFDPPEDDRPAGSGDPIGIQLGDRRAVGWTVRGELDGREYTVLRFRKVLIPRRPGAHNLPAATVTFSAVQRGARTPRGVFDDFFGGGIFDAFGGRAAVEALAIPSDRPRLEVLPLPAEGRPAGFNGWIGELRLVTAASPPSVEVGQPMTLSLTVSGARVLRSTPFPALDAQPAIARDFRVPSDIGAGEARGDALVFTQTLRARHDAVTAIPPVELPHFDPRLGAYRVARSEPIPITVAPSRIVTADDLEGVGASPRQVSVESADAGIGHSYTGAEALRAPPGPWSRWLLPLGPLPVGLALLAVPPLVWCLAMAVRLWRTSPGLLRLPARGPHARWRKAVANLERRDVQGAAGAAELLALLQDYLGARLGEGGSSARAWTYSDVEGRLEGRLGAASRAAVLASLRSVFERCEASRFGGGDSLTAAWLESLVADAVAAVARVEESLR